MSHALARLAGFASAMFWACALPNWTSPAAAQGGSGDMAAIEAAMRADTDANAADIAYGEKKWDTAYTRGKRACDGNNELGCDILGRVLAEGRLGSPDPRGAETAHRKAARLYAERCKNEDAVSTDTCAIAGDFHAINAVPALRNAGLARTYYTRARNGYSSACDRFGYKCYISGVMTEGSFTGRSDPVAALVFYRRGCDAKDNKVDKVSSCNRLVERLAYGPAGVKNEAEARKRITADQCSAAAPGTDGSGRTDKLYCAILAEFLFDGVGGPADTTMAERLMRYACEDGQESACQSLTTRGLERDDMKSALALRDLGLTFGARERFETLCTAQNGFACNEAGRIYMRNFNRGGGNDDRDKALQLYTRACSLDLVVGCANQGSVLLRSGRDAEARTALGKACDAKDATACRQFGVLLAQGRGGPADRAAAVPLYEIACNGNDATGCFELAYSYSRGIGVTADLTRIRPLYEKACELGNNAGCNNLGDALETGRGGAVDLVRARSLYERACKGDNRFACNSLGQLNRDGLGGKTDPVAARALFEKACDLRSAKACNNLSDSLLSSAGGPTDRVKAVTMRRISCVALDDRDACTWLTEGGHRDAAKEGIILANSNKLDRALPLLRQTCNAGNPEGCVGLALATPANDMSEAERKAIFRKACTQGNKDGCAALELYQ
jgi:TPR repeat protein